MAHNNLGNALTDRGSWTRPSPNTARRSGSSPTTPRPTDNLGIALHGQREARRGRRRVPRGDPAEARLRRAHYNLGVALRRPGEAATRPSAEYREAIRLKPDYAEAHCNLGQLLRGQGDYAGRCEVSPGARAGLPAARLALSLGRSGSPTPSAWRPWRRGFPPCSRARTSPKDVAERLAFAQMCYDDEAPRRRRPALGRGPGGRPEARRRPPGRSTATTPPAPPRWPPAGQGEDDPQPDEAARAKLRGQALDWLKAELAAWAKVLDCGDRAPRPLVRQTLEHWQHDPDLAGVRDAERPGEAPRGRAEGLELRSHPVLVRASSWRSSFRSAAERRAWPRFGCFSRAARKL